MEEKSIKAMIIRMEKAALEEWNRGNPSGYLAIYAPDITYFDPMQIKRIDGFEKMEQMYEEVRGKVAVDRYEMLDPVVELSESMAVLSYNLVSYSGKDVWRWNCTEVYQLNSDHQWKIIHNHWSLTPPSTEPAL
ncbi:MAG: nuclear transport factor 2 family protein [Tannerella sp.]|jgi:ketosteroid isomerase-like protein|nr:nuclear transport factor 2 family protein [Tannerella sp.]